MAWLPPVAGERRKVCGLSSVASFVSIASSAPSAVIASLPGFSQGDLLAHERGKRAMSRVLSLAGAGAAQRATAPRRSLVRLEQRGEGGQKADFVASASAGPSSAASSSTTVSQADENRLPRDLTANLSGSVPSEAGCR
jgi:hypothetical protein